METEILEQEFCHEGFFKLSRFRLRHSLFRGGWSDALVRERFERGHEVVAALLYDPARDSVVLVEQFRIGALENPGGAWLMETVAGVCDEGEDPREVIRREVREEAGCDAQDLVEIAQFYVSPGGSTERVHLFCARVDSASAGDLQGLAHEGEDIRVHVLAAEQALDRLRAQTIDTGYTIIALQWLALYRSELRKRWA